MDICFVEQCRTCVRRTHSSVVTAEPGCRQSVVELGERMEMDYPVHWSVSEEIWRIWSWGQVPEAARREVAPGKCVSLAKAYGLYVLSAVSLTELSNFALFLLLPSRMLLRLMSALASCSLLALRELVTEPPSPSLLLYPFVTSLLRSLSCPWKLSSRLIMLDRERAFCAEMLRRPLPGRGDALCFRDTRDAGRDMDCP